MLTQTAHFLNIFAAITTKKLIHFDPEIFLSHRSEKSQGDPADAVFYIQKGSVKLTVLWQRGKEATLACWMPASARPVRVVLHD